MTIDSCVPLTPPGRTSASLSSTTPRRGQRGEGAWPGLRCSAGDAPARDATRRPAVRGRGSQGGNRLYFHEELLVQQLVDEQDRVRRIAVGEDPRKEAQPIFRKSRLILTVDEVVREMNH